MKIKVSKVFASYIKKQLPKDYNISVIEITDDMAISFNADFMKLAQDLSGNTSVKVSIYGKLSPLVIESEKALTLIMPVKE